jgi:hypothetical protein
MRPRLLRQRPGLMGAFVLFAMVLGLGACSDDESSTTAPTGTSVQPLSANYLPLAAGEWWSFVRKEAGIFSPDTTLDYYNPRLPSGNSRWECSAGGGQGDLALLGRTTGRVDQGGLLQHELTVYLDAVSGGYDLAGEAAATDSSFVFAEGLPYAWIRFGTLRWEELLADYSGDTMQVDYDGDEVGKVLVDEALGFTYPRRLYDGTSQPGNTPWDPSDVDHDTYVDGISAVRIVGEVVAEEDFAYASLGAEVDSLCPELEDVVIPGCRWVRLSLEAELHLSNQRNPDTAPGEDAIPDFYIAERAQSRTARRDLGLYLLAPNLGPVVVITYRDLDKTVKVGDPDELDLIFSPDLVQFDYLLDSSLLD